MSSEDITNENDDGNHQLLDWVQQFHLPKGATSGNGVPVVSYTKSLIAPEPLNSVNNRPYGGHILLQDTNLIAHLATFTREEIPGRVVHPKGVGAFGYFEVTDDITKYTRAKVFENVSKRTPIAVRFSNTTREQGYVDTYRDNRGFAIKFYTEEGNWDLVGINAPMFFIQDPMSFPSLIHALKRNPVTNLLDADTFWDFATLKPETVHSMCYMYSDRGIPNGYRHMHGFGVNIFKFVNSDSKAVYVRFHMRTNQGIENISSKLASKIAGTDPDYFTRDMYGAIRSGNYPSWNLCIQVMTFEEAKALRWNPFDITKVWPYGEFPLKPVGKLVLNKNPTNHFVQVEQLAFTPSNMVPGIEPSPDKILQGRMFAYPDTQRYRLGGNWQQLPVNQAKIAHTYAYAGAMRYKLPYEGPNYFPNSFQGYNENPLGNQSVFPVTGDVDRYDTGDTDHFSQSTIFWEKCLTPESRQRLVDNLADHISMAIPRIQNACVELFSNVHSDCGTMLQKALDDRKNKKNKFWF